MPLHSPNILIRFLALLPIVLAVGIWAGHHTLKSDILERHPEHPISLTTLVALMLHCPQPVIEENRAPTVVIPQEALRDQRPHSPGARRDPVRGPPSLA